MMKVIAIPSGLRWSAMGVFLTVPIAMFQAIVMARAPWWALPMRSMAISGAWALGLSIFVSVFLLRARRWFYWVLVGLGTGWAALSALTAVREHNPGMGFFTIFLGVFLGLLASWVKQEFGRSFFDPAMQWYEGSPKSIPAVDCEVGPVDNKTRLNISRLDEEGTFLYKTGAIENVFADQGSSRKQLMELVFHFRNRQVRCMARPMILFKRNSEGVGFRFEGNTPDQHKELVDFIEILRGEGYV